MPFLGHIVGRAGLECDPNKLSAVANWIPPSTIKGVREFLGFTGYYRRFVPDYSTVAQPLVRLLGKDCKFKWTDACQDAFKALCALLIKAPVLAFPKEDLLCIVDTDASDYGIGGVLSQCIEGTEHVIAYYSKSLNPAQQKYCTTRRKLLAVVATLDHFKGQNSRDRIISQNIYSYEPCGLPTGNFMPAESAHIRLMTASPITLRACIPAPDQVTPEQAYFKDLDFYKKTLFHTPFLSRGRAVTLIEYRDAKIVFEVDDWFSMLPQAVKRYLLPLQSKYAKWYDEYVRHLTQNYSYCTLCKQKETNLQHHYMQHHGGQSGSAQYQVAHLPCPARKV